ncbi:hypothetical protein GCM10009416_15350 [Craurococcus roseus]|uniref:YhdP central domain-containing protein n=1 Tax=Craurococcus roseus TaxID=77585 RepID=A0ABN1EYE8_9PROT
MTRRPGQAASRVLRRLVAGLLALLVAAVLGLAALVWRLGEGPLPLPPLARALEQAAAGQLGGGSLQIGEAAIAWQGWRGGAAAPLHIRLSGIKLLDSGGGVRGELPRAGATLSVRALLRGSLALATVELRRPRLVVLRRADGEFDLALQPRPPAAADQAPPTAEAEGGGAVPEAMAVLRSLALPPSDRGGAFDALRRIRVSDGEVAVVDAALGRSWSLVDTQVDIRRADAGGLIADGAATISSGAFSAPVRLHGSASGRPMSVTLGLSLPALRPAQLAAVWPGLGPLSALDASVGLSAAADLDAWGRPERLEAKVAAEPGRLRLGGGHHLPFAALSASAVTEGRGAPIRLSGARLALPPTDAGPGAELTGSGEAALRGGAWEAALDLRATTLPAAALDRAWPEGFEAGLRRAVLGAMPSGTLRGARLALSLRAPETFGEIELVEARAGLEATDAVFVLGQDRRMAVAAAEVSASFRPDGLRLESLSARLPAVSGAAAGPTVTARGGAERRGAGWLARIDVGMDAVRFADLGAYWPEGLAPNVRRWLVQNVTAGEARDGAWRVEAELPEALDAVRVSALSGRAEASGATVHWLRPIPPVQGASGVAEFTLDAVSITARSGARQARADTGGRGAIEVREANVRFHGLDAEPGNAEIALQVSGPLAEAVAVIKHPRLKLFERKPLELTVTGGQADARLRIGFPLLADLPVERFRIDAAARIADAQLRGALLGHDLLDGRFDLTATTEGLKLGGQGLLEGAPVRLNAELDFRPGPPTQVQERATLTGRADPRQIALFGLDTGGLLEGPTAVEARYERRRNGAGTVALRGDLRDARLVFNPSGWEKPPGTAGTVEALLQLQGDALLSAENMRLGAADLSLRGGRALFSAGGKRLEQVEVAEGRFGASRFAGAVRRPAGDGTAEGEAWRAALRGPLLDLRPFLSSGPSPRGKRGDGPDAESRSLPITLDLRFDRALAGETGEFGGVQGSAWFDATGVLRALRAAGRTAAAPDAGGGAFDLSLSPDGGQRRVLRVAAEDGGAFLRAVDVNSISGGRLSVNAAYEELRPGAPLSGTAELENFVLRDAPAAAKVLQAMTLYGLVEAVQGGDGLVFARLVAPFALTPEALVLRDARAFSASLGVTAKGRIGRERRVAEVEGTIVPAYVFNSLLGRVPLVGRLFSPEAGGGLFAATYRVQGPLDDPAVTVNPLAALTPGFLRGLFGIFDQGRGNGGGGAAPR